MVAKRTVIAVSYTHLDVYKRQILYRYRGQGYEVIWKAVVWMLPEVVVVSYTNNIMLSLLLCVFSMIIFLYADVYKRQVMIVAAVILSGTLPNMPAFQDASGNPLGIHVFGEVTLSYASLIEIVIILLAAYLSFKTTDAKIRTRNHFTWGAIQEVAVLFIGIFITMQPALMLLKAHGAELGIKEPLQMFWATGALSSFLDNTPTYLVFLTTAGTLGFTSGMATTVGTVSVKMLTAISCGAVFMGANTYIGNAPNFM